MGWRIWNARAPGVRDEVRTEVSRGEERIRVQVGASPAKGEVKVPREHNWSQSPNTQ